MGRNVILLVLYFMQHQQKYPEIVWRNWSWKKFAEFEMSPLLHIDFPKFSFSTSLARSKMYIYTRCKFDAYIILNLCSLNNICEHSQILKDLVYLLKDVTEKPQKKFSGAVTPFVWISPLAKYHHLLHSKFFTGYSENPW